MVQMATAALEVPRLCCEATHFGWYSSDRSQLLNPLEILTPGCGSPRQDVDSPLWQKSCVTFLRSLVVETALVSFEPDPLARRRAGFEQCLEIGLGVPAGVGRTLFLPAKGVID